MAYLLELCIFCQSKIIVDVETIIKIYNSDLDYYKSTNRL